MDILVSVSNHYSVFIETYSFMIGLFLNVFLTSLGVFLLCWTSYKVTCRNYYMTEKHIKSYLLYKSLKKHLIENNQWKNTH